MNSPPDLILASASPQRAKLLTSAGYSIQIVPSDPSAECGACSSESPREYVARMALQKAGNVVRRVARGLVLACDTVAEVDGQILGKPASEEHARHMLKLLSGREHFVHSGICLWEAGGGEPDLRVETTRLRMDPLTTGQLEEYLRSGEWEGKAGAFGYQDRLGWVHVVQGSETNVVGLPMELLAAMLRDHQTR